MSKKVVLVGHCGPDSSFLRINILKALPEAKIVSAANAAELEHLLAQGAALVLFNRQLDFGFDESLGVDLIRKLKKTWPATKMMLVSNYADAQASAREAGAIEGFGKKEMGTQRVVDLLRDALGEEQSAKE